jgi:hypothetical protein
MSDATPNIAPTTRNSSQQDQYNRSRNTDQGMNFQTLQECISKHSNAQIKEYGSRNATPNIAHTPYCTDQLQECISKDSNAQIKEYGSRNATPNIALTAQIKCSDQGIQIKK